MPTLTFYPSTDFVSDATCLRSGVSEEWAVIIAGAGTDIRSSPYITMKTTGTTNEWDYLGRGITVFWATAHGIPEDEDILSATVSLSGLSKSNGLGIAPNINIYEFDPGGLYNDIVSAKYADVLSVPLCDTPISYADWSITGYNDFVLNATGIALINKVVGVRGNNTFFGFRNANYDVAGIVPSWSFNQSASLQAYGVESGGDLRPKLVVTYGASIYPTHALSRVTGIVYRRSPGRDSMELLMGGIAPDPITRFSFIPETAVPTLPPAPGELPLATGLIGPFIDPVNGAEYWITIDGNIVYTQQLQPRTFPELPEGFEPEPPGQWPG